MKCFKCKTAEAEKTCNCLIVRRDKEYKNTPWGMDEKTKEERIGIYPIGLCHECLGKQAKQWGGLFHSGSVLKSPEAFSAIGVEYRNWNIGGRLNITVPMKEGFYKNQKHFRKHIHYISDEEAEKIYEELVRDDAWKQVMENQTPPAENIEEMRVFLSALDLLTPDVMQKKVNEMLVQKIRYENAKKDSGSSRPDSPAAREVEELLNLYRKQPGGFLTGSAAAEPVRKVGEKLNEKGGMDLMLKAHELFAARCGSIGSGLARNLEMVWDGIGDWRG